MSILDCDESDCKKCEDNKDCPIRKAIEMAREDFAYIDTIGVECANLVHETCNKLEALAGDKIVVAGYLISHIFSTMKNRIEHTSKTNEAAAWSSAVLSMLTAVAGGTREADHGPVSKNEVN